MIRRCLPLLLACALGAQEPSTFGIQLRLSSPSDNLKDTVGGKMGWGGSMGVESDYEDGWKGRVLLGYDAWGPGNAADQSGLRGKVTAGHISAEGVRMLGPEGTRGFTGPYVFLGVGAYGWGVTQTLPSSGGSETRRVAHIAGSAGLGYRFGPHADLEAKVTSGRVDTKYNATFLSLGATYRF